MYITTTRDRIQSVTGHFYIHDGSDITVMDYKSIGFEGKQPILD